jgi:ATP-dependent DNA ligase
MGELWDALYEEDEEPEKPATASAIDNLRKIQQMTGIDFQAIARQCGNEAAAVELEVLNTPAAIDAAIEETLAKKAGPVVNKRKRQGLQLCNVFNPVKPPKWVQVILEPKLDGYRCIARVENGKATLLTSTQLPYGPNVRFIVEQREAAAAKYPGCDNIVLDGEITHKDLPFDVGGGILRLTKPDPRAEGMVYTVWDVLDVEDFDIQTSDTLEVRKIDLQAKMALLDEIEPRRVFKVDHVLGTLADVESAARGYVGEGFEGIVLKNAQGLYVYTGKAGTSWLKWKPTFDGDAVLNMKEGDFRITGGKPGRGKHQGRLGAIFIEGYLLEDGNIQPDPPDDGTPLVQVTGKAGTGFNDAERIQFQAWQDAGTLAGRCVECRYQEISPEKSLRFPVFYRLREDKDE